MADPQKYDRAAAFEMLQKEHGEYASPELINRELDSFEKANGFSSNKPAPADAAAPPTVSKQDQELQDTAKIYALPPSSARQQLESITSANPSTTTPVNNALDSFSKLSTKEQLLYGGGAAALAALATKKAGEIAVEGATKLKDRFFGDNTKPPINTSTQSATNAPLGESELKLSPVDQQILERANVNKQVRQEYLSRTMGNAEPALTTTPEPVVQTPEQIRQAKLAANAQIAQQNMAAAPNVALQPVVPTEAAPVAAAPVEPVATPAAPAEPITTTTETPVTKNTNEKILETINKVAPKAEATPVELPKEELEKPLKWPGKAKGGAGAEGFALQQLGASRATYSKQHAAALEILKDRTNGILTQSPSGGGIHQQEELSKMYEDYTGKPIPKTEKGGWARIPDSQVTELHAGILNELQEAAKSGKLKSLGKGALAAASLLGISEAVQAAQKGNFGPLKEAGFDLGIGVLGGPAVMAGQMALTGQTLASGMTPKGQKEFQNRQEILSRPGVQEHLKYLNVLNPNLSKADFNKRVDAYLATNPNAPKSKLQQFNEQTRQQQIDQTQKEHSLRR